MQAMLDANASSLAVQRTRLHQALLGAPISTSPAADPTVGSAGSHAQADNRADSAREEEMLAQWAAFLRSSKASQVLLKGWFGP